MGEVVVAAEVTDGRTAGDRVWPNTGPTRLRIIGIVTKRKGLRQGFISDG